MSDEPEVVSLAERRREQQARAAAAAREHAREQTRVDPSALPKPWLTYILFGLNLAVWLVMVGAGVHAYEPSGEALVAWGANVGMLTTSGQWWRLLTAMFLHGGIMHLGFNLYFLWAVGRACEQIFGPAAYGVVYFGSGLIASLASAAFHPVGACVGASGALFGIFGALLGFTLRRRAMLNQDFVRTVARNAGVLAVLNIAFSFMMPSIDIVGHIAGVLAGFGLGYAISALAERPVQTREQAKRVQLRAILAAALGCAVVLGAGMAGVPRWDDPTGVMQELGIRHDQLMTRYDAARDPAARMQLIEREILPLMHEAEGSLQALERVPAEFGPLLESRVRYYHVQGQAFALELDGLRSGDEVVLAEAEDLHAEAIAALAGP